MKCVIGSTLAPYKTEHPRDCLSWLVEGERLAATPGVDVSFFAALEIDGRSADPYAALRVRLDGLGGTTWTFRLSTGATHLDGNERLIHICMGRNLVTEYALREGADWVLFLDSDLDVPGDALERLLDVDWPIVGGDVPNYCLVGPTVKNRPLRTPWDGRGIGLFQGSEPFEYPVERHWNTAALLLVHRQLFRRLRWRIDADAGMTDDPCYAEDAVERGWPTLVRKDVYGSHEPLRSVEERGHDLTIR